MMTFNPATKTMIYFVNGVDKGTFDFSTNSLTDFVLNANNVFSAPGNNDFGDFFIFPTGLTGSDLINLTTFLNAKWGIF